MHRYQALFCLLAAAALLAGCGGNDVAPVAPLPEPSPPGGGAGAAEFEVGPLLIRTAATAGFTARDIPAEGPISFVALHGSTITYMASQALLDRIVFCSERDGYYDIWLCGLNGANAVQLTNNTADEHHPCWSPDGRMVAFDRRWPGQDSEIMTMHADGSGVQALTANTNTDRHPSFGPAGRRLAFCTNRDGDYEVYSMFLNGTGVTNLTNHVLADDSPDWSHRLNRASILFSTQRDATPGGAEIYEMNADGSLPVRLTTSVAIDDYPDYSPDGLQVAYQAGLDEILITDIASKVTWDFSASPGKQRCPSWSSDGRFICYTSNVAGDYNLVVQQVEAPYAKFAVARSSAYDGEPDLGSPTLQTDRVLIGPAGADWGGVDPLWSSAYAGIVAFDNDGYRNFVRIGLNAADLGTLEISPLAAPANAVETAPAGVVVEAAHIVNLREDAGRGSDPTVWDLGPLLLSAAVLHFSTDTGKLIAVLALRDAAYPSAAGAPAAVTQSARGDAVVVTGPFAAVFDGAGSRIADTTSRVTIGADGPISVN